MAFAIYGCSKFCLLVIFVELAQVLLHLGQKASQFNHRIVEVRPVILANLLTELRSDQAPLEIIFEPEI